MYTNEWMWALRDAEIDPQLRVIGLLLATYADKDGRMWPTLEHLRLLIPKSLDQDGSPPVSESTVKRARRKLVALGWIKLAKKGDGRGHASLYQLTFPPGINRVWDRSETGSEGPRETGSDQTHQERHQERHKDQDQELVPWGTSNDHEEAGSLEARQLSKTQIPFATSEEPEIPWAPTPEEIAVYEAEARAALGRRRKPDEVVRIPGLSTP